MLTSWHAGKFTAYPPGADICAIVEDRAGDLWIGTFGSGLLRLPHGQTRILSRVENFPASDVSALFYDRDGTLWVGGWGGGLFRRGEDAFENFTTSDGLPSDKIHSIISDREGKLWISSRNGIFGISPQSVRDHVRGQSPPLLWEHFSLAHLGNRNCSGRGQPVSALTADGRLLVSGYGAHGRV